MPCVVHLATPAKKPPPRWASPDSPSTSAASASASTPLPFRASLASDFDVASGVRNISPGAVAGGSGREWGAEATLAVAATGKLAGRGPPALVIPVRSDEASDGEAEDYSPQLPQEWQPLEYEVLEYADALPPGFASRVGHELEAQERTVA